MPDPQEISCYCLSLVTVVSIENISHSTLESESRSGGEIRVELQLAHFSVKEYLLSDRLANDITRDFQERYTGAAIAKSLSCLHIAI